MFLFILKLISTVRRAIAGRRYPSQLAWGLALGVLLGLIPHGNFLTVALVLFVLALQVNHAMVALVGIGLTFAAPKLDPQFHAVGQWFFEQPQVAETMAKAWQWPLVPWTDLNNTVVMGSFLIGLAAVLPIAMLTYPLFRRWSLALESVLTIAGDPEDQEADDDVRVAAMSTTKTTRFDQPHSSLKSAPRSTESSVPKDRAADSKASSTNGLLAAEASAAEPSTNQETMVIEAPIMGTSGRVYDVRRIDPSEPAPPPAASSPVKTTRVAIAVEPNASETRRSEPAEPTSTQNQVTAVNSPVDDQQKIDEALSYLLRQLRDSKDKDAA